MKLRSNARIGDQNGPQPRNHGPPTIEDLLGVIEELTGIVGQTVNLNREQLAREAQAVQQVPRPLNTLEGFQKQNPPAFNGGPDLDVAISWKEKIEKIFEALECSDE